MENLNIQDSSQEKPKNFPKTIFLIVIFLFSALFLSFLYKEIVKKAIKNEFNRSKEISPPTSEKQNISYNSATEGFLKLNTASVYNINQIVELELEFDSANEQVVAMDVLINYDKEKLKFLSSESLSEDFLIYPSFFENTLNLTFVKKLNNNQPVYFKGTPIGKIRFEPLLKGEVVLELISDYKKQQTFFVNEKTEKKYPRLEKKEYIEIK